MGGLVFCVLLGVFGGFAFGVSGCIVAVIGVSSFGILPRSCGWWKLRDFSPCL